MRIRIPTKNGKEVDGLFIDRLTKGTNEFLIKKREPVEDANGEEVDCNCVGWDVEKEGWFGKSLLELTNDGWVFDTKYLYETFAECNIRLSKRGGK